MAVEAVPEGTCTTMCPIAELRERKMWNDFHPLERSVPSFSGRSLEQLAVKKFKRTIEEVDRSPERLRTLPCLYTTVEHLIGLLDVGVDFEDAYKLLWDRLRAVRTDVTVQRLLQRRSKEVVPLYERMVRYHILCSYELCEKKASVSNPHGFDAHLNLEQLNKTLQTLLSVYEDCDQASENEAEFVAYDLLLGTDATKLMRVRRRAAVLGSKEVRFALEVNRTLREKNWVRFFSRTYLQATYLQACVLHLTGADRGMRSHCLGVVSGGTKRVFGPKVSVYPLEDLRAALLLAGESTATNAEDLAEEVCGDGKLCPEVSAKRQKSCWTEIVNGRGGGGGEEQEPRKNA